MHVCTAGFSHDSRVLRLSDPVHQIITALCMLSNAAVSMREREFITQNDCEALGSERSVKGLFCESGDVCLWSGAEISQRLSGSSGPDQCLSKSSPVKRFTRLHT